MEKYVVCLEGCNQTERDTFISWYNKMYRSAHYIGNVKFYVVGEDGPGAGGGEIFLKKHPYSVVSCSDWQNLIQNKDQPIYQIY